jgi:alpha-aminoadipate carrier protein LysW
MSTTVQQIVEKDEKVKCPECDAVVTVKAKTRKNEIIACAECGAELELLSAQPIKLGLAPKEEEDWGE